VIWEPINSYMLLYLYLLANRRPCSKFPPFSLPPCPSSLFSSLHSLPSHPLPLRGPLKPVWGLRERRNLNIDVAQIGKLIYTDFLGQQLRPPKICGPVRPITSNVPKAGPVSHLLRRLQECRKTALNTFHLLIT